MSLRLVALQSLASLRAAGAPRAYRLLFDGGRLGWLRAAGGTPRPRQLHSRPAAPVDNVAATSTSSSVSSTGSGSFDQQLRGGARAERKHYNCPACGQRAYRPAVLQKHMLKCCPDIFRPEVRTKLTALQ